MKKENRKMAQQRRAEERRKKAFRKKVSRILVITIPILAAAILIGVIVYDSVTSSDDSGQTSDTNTESTADTGTSEDSGDTGTSDSSSDTGSSDSSGTEYSTDTSLTVKDGDTVNIDYVGSIDGVEFDGGNTQGQGTSLTIGSGQYIDDFEEQLIGAHPGDTVDVYATFPDPYSGNPDLSGKEALFVVTINGIY